jgi:hypothetical protein
LAFAMTMWLPWSDESSVGADRWKRVLGLLLTALGWGGWLSLVAWRLTRVPGMHMDEAWPIISARGQWPPANPLSGIVSHVGPFPTLLLELFGTRYGLWVLRLASVALNGLTLYLIGAILRRFHPARVLAGWALPLIATAPVWLVFTRTGFEISIFTPVLSVLGLYLLLRGGRWAAFGAGLSWGLLVYNHLLGLYFPCSLALAWLLVYRRLPGIAWIPALGGFVLGVSPRLLAVALYGEGELVGSSVAKYTIGAGVADLKELPSILWDVLHGRTVYLGYVGRVAHDVWPYWFLALLLLLPWWQRPLAVPRHATLALIASLAFCALATVGAPYIAVRYFVLPAIGLACWWVVLGAAAIERDRRWVPLVWATAMALVACNLFYMLTDFYVPWSKQELAITSYRLGQRSARTTTWGYLPKDELVRRLRELDPPPEQIISNATIDRPLRALLADTAIRVRTSEEADKTLRTVFVDYHYGPIRNTQCLPVPYGQMCFRRPEIIDNFFLLYR